MLKTNIFSERCANVYFNIPFILFVNYSDGSGSKIFDPGRVRSIFCGPGWVGMGRVSHLWFGFESEKFPLKMSNVSIFLPSGQKNLFGLCRKVHGSKVGRPLIYCGSKVSSGQVRAHLSKMWLTRQNTLLIFLWIQSKLIIFHYTCWYFPSRKYLDSFFKLLYAQLFINLFHIWSLIFLSLWVFSYANGFMVETECWHCCGNFLPWEKSFEGPETNISYGC